MTTPSPRQLSGLAFGLVLGALVVLNLILGYMFAPGHISLHHTPIVQIPNFLAFLHIPGIDGPYIPGHVAFTWLVMGILVVGATLGTRAMKPMPGPMQNVAEVATEGFIGFLEQMIGPHGRQYLPLIGTAGLFILVSNLLPNIPGFQPPTANLNTTVGLALTVFISYNYFGVRRHGWRKYLGHFTGPIWWLAPLMFPIEFIGHLARPVSLSIRLFGNIFGEESVIVILLSLAWLVMPYLIWLGVMLPLSLFTAAVQTFVFVMLSTVYIAGAVEEGHEEHH
jgi:F-type H+-transporting ATPase subunit a